MKFFQDIETEIYETHDIYLKLTIHGKHCGQILAKMK